jgi:Flp pilus assembly protein TadG
MNSPTRQLRERGTQIVELAISLPLLMFLALALVDGGALLHAHQIINSSAREGARLSAQPENAGASTAIQNAVVQYCANNGLTIAASDVTVNQTQAITLPDATVMSYSTVTVVHNYPVLHLSKLAFFKVAPSVNLKGSASFGNLYSTF